MLLSIGNPLSLDPFQDDQHPLFFGKAMLILRRRQGRAGPVTVTATAEGVQAGKASLHTVRESEVTTSIR